MDMAAAYRFRSASLARHSHGATYMCVRPFVRLEATCGAMPPA
jgi:hypothetical protein